MVFNINITQYYQYYSILLIQYYSIFLTLKTVLFQFNMCQYSSILQAISNIRQYSSILPEQLGDGQAQSESGTMAPPRPLTAPRSARAAFRPESVRFNADSLTAGPGARGPPGTGRCGGNDVAPRNRTVGGRPPHRGWRPEPEPPGPA